MSKTCFLSLVCPDFDDEILPVWCRHYRGFNFDRYSVFVHSPSSSFEKISSSCKTLKNYGFEIIRILGKDDTFRSSLLKVELFEPFCRDTLDFNDRVIIADSDDFHDVPYDDYKKLALEYDCIKGKMIDRWDDDLSKYNPAQTLDKQYPHSGWMYDILHLDCGLNLPTPPLQDKYITSIAGDPLNYTGGHYFIDRKKKRNVCPEEFIINHYTFRPNIFDRSLVKAHYNIDYLYYLAKFFNITDIPETLQNAIAQYKEEQYNKGWMVGSDGNAVLA